jgi:hypothetical protein
MSKEFLAFSDSREGLLIETFNLKSDILQRDSQPRWNRYRCSGWYGDKESGLLGIRRKCALRGKNF